MKKTSLTVLFASMTMLSASAIADDHMDFSTVTKVQYVNDCMQANTNLNVYEGVHKCSCVVDKLDEAFTQTDDEGLSGGIDKYEEVSASAYKECRIQ